MSASGGRAVTYLDKRIPRRTVLRGTLWAAVAVRTVSPVPPAGTGADAVAVKPGITWIGSQNFGFPDGAHGGNAPEAIVYYIPPGALGGRLGRVNHQPPTVR